MKKNKIIILFCIINIIMLLLNTVDAQQPTRSELINYLRECEDDLEKAITIADSLKIALKETKKLYEIRRQVADSLVENLNNQLFIQDSVSILMRTNADTLKLMVDDYGKMLDKVNKLYIKELERQKNPWWLSKRGLTGLVYGVLLGGAIGSAYSAFK